MKRDFDVIRDLLLEIEQKTTLNEVVDYYQLGEDDDATETQVYHAKLLLEAGYANGNDDGPGAMIFSLTWAGHDLLDTIRDDTVWRKTKEKVSKGVASTSIEIIKGVAEGITRGMIFGPGSG
ncbi:MAG: DUF2513 domain-containing protein [Rubricoccaceae bacterium]